MSITPIGYRVLVRPDEIETKTESGIVLALNEKLEKSAQMVGTVVSYGDIAWKATEIGEDGRQCGEPWVQPGDRVLYAKFGGKLVIDPESGEEFALLQDVDILAKI